MKLTEMIRRFRIDVGALVQARHRVWYVSRLGRRRRGRADRRPILFASRRRLATLPPSYRARFADVQALDFETILDTLKPALSEEVETARRLFPFITLRPAAHVGSDGAGTGEGDLYIGAEHPLFAASIAGSPHEAHRGMNNGLDDVANAVRGLGLLKQLRADLKTFLKFQKINPELIRAAARVFERCAGGRDLPAFEAGDPLPAGFRSTFFAFVYAETRSKPFPVSELDFSAEPWQTLTRDQTRRATFAHVVEAMRDRLVAGACPKYEGIEFEGGRLSDFVEEELSAETCAAFADARRALHRMMQTLRDRTARALILEFMIDELYALVETRSGQTFGPDSQAARSRLVADAVVGGKFFLPKPVKRATKAERDELKDAMTIQFDGLVRALLSDTSEAFDKAAAKLSGPARALAQSFQGNPEKRVMLTQVANALGVGSGADALAGALRILVQDVVCPVLFDTPKLSRGKLRSVVQIESVQTFLAALLLSDAREDDARRVASAYLADMDTYLDRPDRTRDDLDRLVATICGGLIEQLVFTPQMVLCLTTELALVREVGSYEKPAAGVGGLCVSVTPSLGGPTSGEATPAHPSELRRLYEAEAKESVERRFATAPAANGKTGEPAATRVGRAVEGAIAVEQPKPPKGALDVAARNDLHRRVVDRLTADGSLRDALHDDMTGAEKALAMVVDRYAVHQDKPEFCRAAERLALASLMLAMGDELDLGGPTSHLLILLLDVVGCDPEHPEEFFERHSLTRYFDVAELTGSGLGTLRQTLARQGSQTEKNLSVLVSELRGLEHLVEGMKADPMAELVFFDMDPLDFVDWLEDDTLAEGPGHLRLLQHGMLVTDDGNGQRVAPPALCLVADSAFAGKTTRAAFLNRLKTIKLTANGRVMGPLPFVLNTGPVGRGDPVAEGHALAQAAEDLAMPVTIVGPSIGLSGPYYLPAAHALVRQAIAPGRPHRLGKPDTGEVGLGRFVTIGAGGTSLEDSLDRAIFGPAGGGGHSLAVDHYLVTLARVLGAAWKSGGREAVDAAAFYRSFVRTAKVANEDAFLEVSALDGAALGDCFGRYGLEQELSAPTARLESVRVGASTEDVLSSRSSVSASYSHVNWLNVYRSQSGMP